MTKAVRFSIRKVSPASGRSFGGGFADAGIGRATRVATRQARMARMAGDFVNCMAGGILGRCYARDTLSPDGCSEEFLAVQGLKIRPKSASSRALFNVYRHLHVPLGRPPGNYL